MNEPSFSEKQSADAMKFAMDVLQKMPKGDALEANLTGTLVVLWGALWGSFGTDYARDFIQAQLAGMEGNADVFTPPRVQ
jgi:hypothetical protein